MFITVHLSPLLPGNLIKQKEKSQVLRSDFLSTILLNNINFHINLQPLSRHKYIYLLYVRIYGIDQMKSGFAVTG